MAAVSRRRFGYVTARFSRPRTWYADAELDVTGYGAGRFRAPGMVLGALGFTMPGYGGVRPGKVRGATAPGMVASGLLRRGKFGPDLPFAR